MSSFVRSALIGVAFGVSGCATTVPRGEVTFVEAARVQLPNQCEALLNLVDSSAVGPAGPDLVNAYRAAEEAVRRGCGQGGPWRAKRALYLLSLSTRDDDLRAHILGRCGQIVRPSTGPAEGDFYHALCLGMRALDNKTEALGLIKEMVESGNAALHKNPTVVHGGPHRLLGGVYLRAPGWPLSVGDVELALEHLSQAIRLASAWPENLLLYAEALLADDRPEEARAALAEAKALLTSRDNEDGWNERWAPDVAALEESLAPKSP